MDNLIILIKGKARSGKDTFAMLLRKHLEYYIRADVDIHHNAKEMLSLAHDYFGWDGVSKEDRDRKLFQDLTKVGYDYDYNFWEKVNPCTESVTIIPDWRYINTFDFYKEKGYNIITIEVLRTHRQWVNSRELDNHYSEKWEFNCDYEVVNDTTLSELDLMAKDIAIEITMTYNKWRVLQ